MIDRSVALCVLALVAVLAGCGAAVTGGSETTGTTEPTPMPTLAQDRLEVRTATVGESVVLTVRANTSMAHVDGDEENPGEPLLVVLHEGRQLVRQDVERGPDTTVEVAVPTDDFPAEVRGGRTEVTVRLLDRDSLFDDLLATWTGPVDVPAQGSPDAGASDAGTSERGATATGTSATTTAATATAGATTTTTGTETPTVTTESAARPVGAAEF